MANKVIILYQKWYKKSTRGFLASHGLSEKYSFSKAVYKWDDL